MRAEADGHRSQALKSGLIYGLPLLWARGCNPHADMGTAPAVAQKIKGFFLRCLTGFKQEEYDITYTRQYYYNMICKKQNNIT